MNRGGRSYQLHWPVSHNDVLNGRGVNIAQHAGNERFRALVNARYDPEYCSSYSTSEKRALAEEIISHIQSLTPPGRFLKRPKNHSKQQGVGLGGPWEELSREETIKKTCQALRDCSRKDRAGYGASVSAIPEDVVASTKVRSQSGMTNKQLAELAAKEAIKKSEGSAFASLSQPRVYGTTLSSSPSTQPMAVASSNVIFPSSSPSGLKRKATEESNPTEESNLVPSWMGNDPLRAMTPPVYEPATKQNKVVPEITPNSPGGFSASDFGPSDHLLSAYASSTHDDTRNPFSDIDLLAPLDDTKPAANDSYLDDFDGHAVLPGVIQDSLPSSPLSDHPRFPEE